MEEILNTKKTTVTKAKSTKSKKTEIEEVEKIQSEVLQTEESPEIIENNELSELSDSDSSVSEVKVTEVNETLSKLDFLNDIIEVNKLYTKILTCDIKKIIFSKEELKIFDTNYRKIGSNKENLNNKILLLNRNVKKIKISKSSNSSDNESDKLKSSEHLSKEDLLNSIIEINKLYVKLLTYNIKDFDFTSENLKIFDTNYRKIGSNREVFNVKILTNLNRDVKIKKSNKTSLKKDITDENETDQEIKKDTSNHPVNRKQEAFKEVLVFLDKPEDTLVSRTDVHIGIRKFIQSQEEKQNPDIYYDETKKSYKIIGKMKDLFDFIHQEKIKRGKITEKEELPEFIKNGDIMKYTSYCFPQVKK